MFNYCFGRLDISAINGLKHIDSHPCIRLEWSRRLHWWSHADPCWPIGCSGSRTSTKCIHQLTEKTPLMFLKDIWSTLPNFHFMFLDRYWSHIENFGDLIRRISGKPRCPSFRKLSTFWIFNIQKFITRMRFKNVPEVFSILFRCPGVPKIQLVGFGAWWRVQKLQNHKNEEFEPLPSENRDIINPNRSRIVLESH